MPLYCGTLEECALTFFFLKTLQVAYSQATALKHKRTLNLQAKLVLLSFPSLSPQNELHSQTLSEKKSFLMLFLSRVVIAVITTATNPEGKDSADGNMSYRDALIMAHFAVILMLGLLITNDG